MAEDVFLHFIALGCKGVMEELHLVQNCVDDKQDAKTVYLFDCVKLGSQKVCHFLKQMFQNASVFKLCHDIHREAAVLLNTNGVQSLGGLVDTQLVMESFT